MSRLEEQVRLMKNQLTSVKEITNQYSRLEKEYRNLSERYADRIEHS